MKKLRLFLLTLVATIAGTNIALADAYTVDFNTAITTSDHAFQVASNWRHIVGTYNDNWGETSYPSYSYSATAGVDGSGALSCITNQSSNSIYDLLVTPVVKGTVTIAAKTTASYYTPQLTFYKITDNGDGTFTRGNQITVDVSAINATDFTTITIPVDEAGERIGIRSSYVWLDNFSATEATIVPEPKMTIASAEPTATTGTIYWNQQANGKVLVSYTVTVTNTGEVDLTQGDEDFSVSIINRSTGDVYATVAVPQNLAKGETSDKFVVSAEVETSLWPNSYTYINMDLKENLFGSTVQRAQSHYKAYESKFVFREAGSNETSSLTSVNWGIIREAQSKNFEVTNLGTAPMTISSYTLTPNSTDGFALTPGFSLTNLPEGVTINYLTQEVTMAGGSTLPFTVTKDDTPGVYSGTLTIGYTPYGAEATNFTLSFAATMIGANTWMADFNNTTSTAVYPQGSVKEGGISTDWDNKTSDGKYNIYLKGIANQASYKTENNKFITPKLHANAGDQLAFDVKAGYSSNDEYFVKVYVSADRVNWGDPVQTYVYSTVGSSFTTKTLSFDTAGDYYVAFAIYGTGSGIDNLVGLEKVDVTHDLYIKSVNWPHDAGKSVKSGTALSKPSIDIIPLTDEVAANYTVKYIYGDNEVAIASKALTASASSTTSFAASFTPTVETTTTFPGTKVVFEFTDGTKFESETFDLTVTNEPIFHFLGSKHTSRWYEPTSDYTTPVNFGKTNTSGTSKTFYVLNWGSAPLTVKSIAVPNGFTTSAESMNIPAFDGTQDGLETCQQALDITFSATEAGTYSGDMVITYVNGVGEDATFTLAVSGTMLDPTKWYANFNDQQWPAGSIYQDNVSISYINTGDYGLLSSSATKNLFITPKLTATANDVLQFDASTRNSYYNGSVKVYISTDRENFGEPVKEIELSKTDNVSKSTYEYQFAAAGDYYVAFALEEARVDDIYGLSLTPVEHDWQIASSNIPAEAMQNTTVNATVNIANFGIAEEAAGSYNVTVYVDEEPVTTIQPATAIPTVNKLSDAGTQISVPFKYGVVGTFPVYIEVEADGYKVKTEPVEVNFTGEIANADAIAVGSGTTFSYNYAPIDFFNFEQARTSDIVYTAAQLKAFGIDNSNKITTLAFRGTVSSAKTLSKSSLKAWVGLVSDYTLGTPNKTALTEIQIYNAGDMVFVSGTNELTITLPEAITYDGTSNLRIYLEGGGNSEYVSWNFASDANYPNMKWSNNAATKYNPILYVTLASEVATLTGTVTDGTNPVEGATVTMISEDADKVQYTGETDADGKYSIEVIQASRTYTVTASKDGAEATVKNVSDFSQPMNLALVALPELTINNEALAATAPDVANVTIARSLKTGWNAIVLPVTLTAAEIKEAFGENIELAAYDSDEGTTNVTVKFTNATKIVAGTPYLLWLESVPATAPRFVNKTIAKDTKTVTGQVFDFVGTYQSVIANAGDYFIQGGKFVKATSNNTILPFRSYLKLKDGGAGARYIRFSVNGEDFDVPTAIEAVATEAPAKLEGIYNLQGQKVDQLKKGGLYIINGKKVMVK